MKRLTKEQKSALEYASKTLEIEGKKPKKSQSIYLEQYFKGIITEKEALLSMKRKYMK